MTRVGTQNGIVVTTREALEAENAFVQISRLDGWERNNVGSYRTERVRRRLATALETYRADQRALVKKFGADRQPTSREIQAGAPMGVPLTAVTDENLEVFAPEHDLLLEAEVTVDARPLALTEFAGVCVKPEHFRAIWKFVNSPDEEAP